jgi:predicted nucleic acid-binding protein
LDTNVCIDLAGRRPNPDKRLVNDLPEIIANKEDLIWVINPTVHEELIKNSPQSVSAIEKWAQCFKNPLISETRYFMNCLFFLISLNI